MKIVKRDWIVVAAIAALFGFLLMGKGRQNPGEVPNDEKHNMFYEAIGKGGDRVMVEKGCLFCHGTQGVPLSKGHPPKEECLICHKYGQP